MLDSNFINWPFFSDEHKAIEKELSGWIAKQRINEKSEEAASKEWVKRFAENKWLELSVPKPYGGRFDSLDVRALCLAREALAYHDGLADFAFAMQGLGSGPISLFGSEEQKQEYLPKVSGGEIIPAFALSELDAGSDVSALATTAEKNGDSYILNGKKSWISNAGLADLYVVFARTGDAPGAKGLSAFIVEADTPGFSVIEKTAITSPHPVGTIQLDNCKVHATSLLSESGSGFKVAMGTLDVFRSTVGAAALGFAKRALDEALAFSIGRELFGEKLSAFQMTQDKIASMATDIDAAALLIYRAAWMKDNGAERVTREASMAKLYATESAQDVIDKAVQILGGRGVVADSVVERLYRDIRPLRIYEGTSEIQKIVIAGQVLKNFNAER